MQRGYIYKRRGSWLLRYWDLVIAEGQPRKVRRATRLAPVNEDYPSKRSVLLLAEKVLAPLNSGQIQAESSLSVVKFIDLYYFPHVKKELRPSTYKDYNDVFRVHLKARLGDIRLRDFRTVHGQRILRDITGVGHSSLLRIKSFLSGVFKHAKREGFLDGENPMRDVSVPGRPVKFRGPVYTMSEIEKIGNAVGKKDMRAFTAISVAAFAGLRLSEIRGLRWSDYDGRSLRIARSVWRTKVSAPKTESSEGSVPVLPLLQKILNEHRIQTNPQNEEAYIFAGERRGVPLNLANLVRRVILPALAEYESEADEVLQWKGWHAFRRSLASNLYSCGVSPKVIQAILRHSDIGTTLDFYVQTPDDEARAALQKIEDWMAVT